MNVFRFNKINCTCHSNNPEGIYSVMVEHNFRVKLTL